MRCALSSTQTLYGKEFCVRKQRGRSLACDVGVALVSSFAAHWVIGFWGSVAVLILALFASATSYESEKLVVWEGLGITLESRTRLGNVTSRFIELERIKDVVLSEVMTSVSVDFYLVFVVRGQDKLAVAFEHLKPRLAITQQVYQELCAMGAVA